MAERYCTSCGNGLGSNDAFCASCGRPTHETAAVSTLEANVDVPAPPEDEGQPERRGGIKKVVKVDRLDKIVGLIVGAGLLLAVLWFVFQFFVGLLSGLFAL